MSSWTEGTALFEADFRKQLEGERAQQALTDGSTDAAKVTDDEVHRAMALAAMNAKSTHENDAIKALTAFREAYGPGVNTQVMLYNGLGVPIKLPFSKRNADASGQWTQYMVAERLEVGQWTAGLHGQANLQARGSKGAFRYEIAGYGHDVVVVGFHTPWGTDNPGAFATIMTSQQWDQRGWDWTFEQLDKLKYSRGYVSHNESRVTFSIRGTRWAVLEVVLMRRGIGY